MPIKRINLWSSPRNISTALMYSFAQRKDTTVVDEPLYAHYLSKTDTLVEHPAKEEILQSQEQDGEKVVRDIILGSSPSPVILFKQMTLHLIFLQEDFLMQTENVLLIRDPRAIIASYVKVVPNPSHQDIGIQKQFHLFNKLEKNGKVAAVVDARELLLNPRSVLRQLCRRLDLTFDKNMLHWKAGPRPEDGVWAKYWYATVHHSTGFRKYEEKEIRLPEKLEQLARECRPYYDFLLGHSLRG